MAAPPLDELAQDHRRLLRRLSPWCVAIIGVIFAYLLIYHIHHERRDKGHLGDFPTFYQAAQFARDHRDIYTAGRAESDQMYVYPPLIAVTYIPLTYLSLANAAMVMLFLTEFMLLGSIMMSASTMLFRLGCPSTPLRTASSSFPPPEYQGREKSEPSSHFVLTLVASALIAILSEDLLRGVSTMLETDAIMLLLFVLALVWLDRFPILCGLALGFAFNIKYLSIVFLPYLLLRRRWKAAAGLVLGSILFALLPAVQLGWHEDLRCLRVSMGGLLRWVGVAPAQSGSIAVHDISDALSSSITSFLGRILARHGFSSRAAMAAAGCLGIVCLLLIAVLYIRKGLPLFIWPARDRQREQPYLGLVALEWAGLIALTLAFSPNTNARHLVLTIIVYAAAAALLLIPAKGVSKVSLIAAMIFIPLAFILPGSKTMRHLGLSYLNGIPCWALLIGYFVILQTGLSMIARTRDNARLI